MVAPDEKEESGGVNLGVSRKEENSAETARNTSCAADAVSLPCVRRSSLHLLEINSISLLLYLVPDTTYCSTHVLVSNFERGYRVSSPFRSLAE